MVPSCWATLGLGVVFLGLEALEWRLDLHEGLVPGPGCGLHGADADEAELFYCFYWVAMSLRTAHTLIGLVGWIAWRDRRGEFSPGCAHRTSR